MANVRKSKRTDEGREECKDLGCSPCRRPRAIDSRASRPLGGRGTRERGTREGIPAGEGEESGDEHGGRARRARARERNGRMERGGRGKGERERRGRERGAGGGGSVSDDGGGREEAVSMARATTR